MREIAIMSFAAVVAAILLFTVWTIGTGDIRLIVGV